MTVAVFDIGKTNLKLLAIREGAVLETLTTANRPRPAPPYLHSDLAAIETWLLGALGQLAARHRIEAVVASGHGSGGVLVDEAGPVLPMMDYEAEAPEDIVAGYAAVAPAFEEAFCAIGGGASRLGGQLFWQSRAWPEAFARARWLLMLPQYWAWRLSGVAASELTTLGAQTHLWNHAEGRLTGLAERMGWARLLPPLRPAWDAQGPIRPEVAAATGLDPTTPVLCGIHDSNANYFRYLAAGLQSFVLLSTGTWIIGFNAGLPLARMDGSRGMVANTDPDGRPISCTLIMFGREYAVLAGGDAEPDADAAARLVARGTLALPSFVDFDGVFPGSAERGRIDGPPPETAEERAALATLYCALGTAVCLDLLQAAAPVIVDGGFAANPLFAPLLAALRPDLPVQVSDSRDGTALGAALLWHRNRGRPAPPLALRQAAPAAIPGLAAYAARWRALAEGGAAAL